MLNEAELIEKETIYRQLRIDAEALETRRSMARWLALSLGIINPGETRQSAVAVLDALVNYQFVKKEDPDAESLKSYINANWDNINEKTLRYHLLRFKKMGIIENAHGKFYFRLPASGDRFNPDDVFSNMFEQSSKEVVSRVSKVINELKDRSKLIGGQS
ncbi:MAG: hypothetical protein QW091_01905 [Candidatus Micrarchaeaceae archaeon]